MEHIDERYNIKISLFHFNNLFLFYTLYRLRKIEDEIKSNLGRVKEIESQVRATIISKWFSFIIISPQRI